MSKTEYEIIKSIGAYSKYSDNNAYYQKMVVSLCETIRLMREVDGVIESAGGWAVI